MQRFLVSLANLLVSAGSVDPIGILGHYYLVSMVLNVDQYFLPDGCEAELKALPWTLCISPHSGC
jgi:hypothetical protein